MAEPAAPAAPTADLPPRRRTKRWWARKRLLVPLTLLAVIVSAVQPRGSTPPPQAGSGLGTPVRDGNLEFVVSRVRCGVSQVGSGLLTRTAGGQYCLADVRATNVKRNAPRRSTSHTEDW